MRKNNNYLTDTEFEDFLGNIGGVVNDRRPTDKPITTRKVFGVGNGWLGIIQRLFETLIKLGWNKEYVLIKQKFGGMSIFLSNIPKNSHHFIVEAEKESHYTCEVCGEPGKERTIRGWIHTMCDEHYNEKTTFECDGKIYISEDTGEIKFDDLYYDARSHQVLKCKTDNFFDPWSVKVIEVTKTNE